MRARPCKGCGRPMATRANLDALLRITYVQCPTCGHRETLYVWKEGIK